MSKLRFEIPGKPGSKLRHRTFITSGGKQIQYTPKETQNFEAMASMCASLALKESGLPMFTGPISIRVDAYFQVPATRKKHVKEGDPHTQKPDADNVLKTIDHGNSILWHDDCIISEAHVYKYWTHQPPHTLITVESL